MFQPKKPTTPASSPQTESQSQSSASPWQKPTPANPVGAASGWKKPRFSLDQLMTPARGQEAESAQQRSQPPKPLTKPPLASDNSELSTAELRRAKDWYAANAAQYTPAVIKQIQRAIKAKETGKVTDEFLQAVATWQVTTDLLQHTSELTETPSGYMSGFPKTGVILPDQLALPDIFQFMQPPDELCPTQLKSVASLFQSQLA